MDAKKIFDWLGEQQLKSAFRNWWVITHPADIVPSYRTLIRIEYRLDHEIPLTKPQKKAARRAEEFYRFWADKNKSFESTEKSVGE